MFVVAPIGDGHCNNSIAQVKKLRKYFVSIEKSYTFALAIADMAQLVEQRIRNAWVPGSSPGIGSRGETFISPFFLCGISTSVVHGLPKPGRRVRFPYPALFSKIIRPATGPDFFCTHAIQNYLAPFRGDNPD
jgi:hypothetical protein